MNTSKLLLTFTAILGILVLTAQATPVQPSTSPTPTPEQHHVTMETYTTMVASVVRVQQTIWLLLREQSSPRNFTAALAQPFEYCFLQDVANPPSNNLTVRNYFITNNTLFHAYIAIHMIFIPLQIEQRMSIDYQVIEELTVPLRDVMNYEARNSNDSDMYQKLMWAESQINSSLEEIQDMVCTYVCV